MTQASSAAFFVAPGGNVSWSGRLAGFDPYRYLASNPDLATAFGTNAEAARQHSVARGHREGRGASFAALASVV